MNTYENLKTLSRRRLLTGAGLATLAGLSARSAYDFEERGRRTSVFAGRAADYDEAALQDLIAGGLKALGLGPRWAAGKSVLLKPNLVEPSRQAPQINTNPALVRSAAEVFRRWGAREVVVGEGQGHCRDTDYVLVYKSLTLFGSLVIFSL